MSAEREAATVALERLVGPCNAAFDEWYSAQRHQLTNEQVCRLIWARGWAAALAEATRQLEQEADGCPCAEDKRLTFENADMLREWSGIPTREEPHFPPLPALPNADIEPPRGRDEN